MTTDFTDLLIFDGINQRSTDNDQPLKSLLDFVIRNNPLQSVHQFISKISGQSSLPKPTDTPHVAAVFLGWSATRCITARFVPQPLLFEDGWIRRFHIT